MNKLFSLVFLIITVIGCSSLRNIEPKGFTKEEMTLITSKDSTKPMRVYKIPNKLDYILLRTKSAFIKPDPNDKMLLHFINRLYKTVRDSMSMGVGIAAPQVGILKNIIWVQRFDKENFPFEVYLNPEILNYSTKKQTFKEGCLSIPNRSDTLYTRAYSIHLKYNKIDGTLHNETVEGLTSVIFQHEIDHLNGILYLDHLKKEIQNGQ